MSLEQELQEAFEFFKPERQQIDSPLLGPSRSGLLIC